MIRKAIIKEKLSSAEYLVEDVFEKKTFTMRVSAKQRLNRKDFKTGDEVYLACSPYEPNRCRLLTSTDFKMGSDNSLNNKKFDLDERHRKIK